MSVYGELHPRLGAVVRFCIGRPYTVLAITGLVCFALAPCAVQFIPHTVLGTDPPEDFKSMKAAKLVRHHFPIPSSETYFIITIALKGNKRKYVTSSMLSTERVGSGCQYSDVECIHRFWQHGAWPSLLQGVRSALTSTASTVHYERGQGERYGGGATAPILDVPGLTEFSFALNESLSQHKRIDAYLSNSTLWALGVATTSLINDEGTATQITFKIEVRATDTEAQDFSEKVHDIAKRLVQKYLPEDDIDWGLSSTSFTMRAAASDAEKSSLMMEAVSLPMTGIVLLYMLRSVRLLLVPVVIFNLSITISFGIMFLVGQYADILASTPSMMTSVGIAMTIDYCLFILTRFRAELLKSSEPDVQKRVADATATAMDVGGWSILVSGGTLTLAFAVMTCFPMPNGWQAYGAGGTTALAVLVIVHIVVVPAFLQLMPEFWSRCAPPPQDSDSSTRTATSGEPQQSDWVLRLWRGIASLSSEPAKAVLILIIVTAVTVSIGYRFADMTLASDLLMLTPKGTDAWHGYELMQQQFGKGPLGPTRVLTAVDGDKYDSFLAQEPWEDSQMVFKEIIAKMPHTKGIKVSAASFFHQDGVSHITTWAQFAYCMEVFNIFNATCISLRATTAQYISADRQAQLASVVLDLDPGSEATSEFIDRLRELLDKLEKKTVLKLEVSGAGAIICDIVDKLDELFPYIVMTTFILAFMTLAISFHSLVYPLVCVLTIGLTVLFTYGLAVRIYQDSFLEWTGVESLRNRFDALPVGNHIAAFSVVVGLCLDYDVFLMSSVTECRAEGMSAKDAIVEGLCRSGGIITAAGTIMAFAFVGPMYCTSVYTVHVSSYFLTVSVLYDTFIIRSFVVPAAMIILGRFTWWPSDLAYDKTD